MLCKKIIDLLSGFLFLSHTKLKDEELNKGLSLKGFRDGVKHNPDVLSIDGLSYHDIHIGKFNKLRSIAKKFVEAHK